jgi:hypothetical protein
LLDPLKPNHRYTKPTATHSKTESNSYLKDLHPQLGHFYQHAYYGFLWIKRE